MVVVKIIQLNDIEFCSYETAMGEQLQYLSVMLCLVSITKRFTPY